MMKYSDDRTISAKVNSVLQTHGFVLHKGDAKRVAEALVAELDKSAITDEAVVTMGTRLDLAKSKYALRSLRDIPIEQDMLDQAGEWLAGHALTLLQDDNLLVPIIDDLIDAAVNGMRYTVVIEETSWDVSTRPRAMRQPWDLSRYDTLGDFMAEPDGSTEATYESGSGLRARTFEDTVFEDYAQLECDVARRAVSECPEDAPAFVRETIKQLVDDESTLDMFQSDLVVDKLVDLGVTQYRPQSVERVAIKSFREELLKRYPNREWRLTGPILK